NESAEHGIGLGLGVVRRLSHQMQCKIHVDSEVGRGSCFSLSFPVSTPQIAQQQMQGNPTASFGSLRVLCVDDQQENLDAMQTLLERWGISVVLADNWDDAIKQADIFSPQILLMDYQLGNGVNGLDLIEAIRQHLDVVLPASLVTATHDEDLVTRCKEQGVNYLSKPLKPAKLRALLKSMTRHVKPAR
ncbi:MAG: response regulator, partial [Gammaproteobacteria bacterium]|nr:response regulator [Gammaproteobacteria bacterium]